MLHSKFQFPHLKGFPVATTGVVCVVLSIGLGLLSACSSGGSSSSSSSASTGANSSPVTPTIATQPKDISTYAGATATFSVTASGTAPLHYQWARNGSDISGATSSSYTTPALLMSDSGEKFTVTVSNTAGSVQSSAATLTVTPPPPAITQQPTGGFYFSGEKATLAVIASGENLVYQWQKNGSDISGATTASYTTPALTSKDDNTSYAVVVGNDAGKVTSGSAVIRMGPIATNYTTQQGDKLNLYAWPGTKMAILTESDTEDVAVMRKFLTAADGTYSYYAKAVGREPSLYFNYNGLPMIAQVKSACGAGCTFIGATGMEIEDPFFAWMTDAIPNGAYDQIMFYEMGRSFWLFPQLQFASPDDGSCFVTGFAVLMRYRSIAAQGYQGSSNSFATGPNDTANAAYGIANYNAAVKNTEGLIDNYAANPSLNWSNTFLVNHYSGSNGLGCTDLFASLVQRLAKNYGDEDFIQGLWKEVLKRPVPSTTQGAMDNFILAASAAANKNLSRTFMTTWKWPESTEAQTEAQSRWGDPE